MFGWKEWDKNLLHMKGNPVKILEIGIGKGETMEKFTQIFLESNKEAEYYGIHTFKKDLDSEQSNNDIKKIVLDKKEHSLVSNKIFIMDEDTNTLLQKYISDNIVFDIVYINSSYFAKDILLDAVLSMKLLKLEGIMLFNNYLWEKLEPNIYSPKPAIDAILNIYKNEIIVLFIGYQVIIKKTNLKTEWKKKDKTITDELIKLFDNYWLLNDIREIGLFLQLKELPNIEEKYDKFESIKIPELKNIDIFYKLKISNMIFKYNKFNFIKDELKNNKTIDVNKLKKLEEIGDLNEYGIFNTVQARKMGEIEPYKPAITEYTVLLNTQNKPDSKDITSRIIRNSMIFNTPIKLYGINLIKYAKTPSLQNLDEIINELKNNNMKTELFMGHHLLDYPNLNRMYNNILLQILLLKHTLQLDGKFQIILELRYDFINDLCILLNYLFKKLKIIISSNKIGRLTIRITTYHFLGIDDNLYNKLYNLLKNADTREIISIFNHKEMYINYESIQNNIFSQTKKITDIIVDNQDIVIKNRKYIEDIINRRTIDDVSKYIINKNK
jgi:hypothetical protein